MCVYLEHPRYSSQQGAGQHHVEGLSRQQDLSQVLGGAVCQGVRGQPLTAGGSTAAWGSLRPGCEFVTDIFGDSLGVGDGQEAVLLVRDLQDLGCSLASGQTDK